MFRAPRWCLVPLRLVVGFGFLAHGWARWSRGPSGFARLLALALAGPSAWSVDEWLGRRRAVESRT